MKKTIRSLSTLATYFDLKEYPRPSHLPRLLMKLHLPFRGCLSAALLLLLAEMPLAYSLGPKQPPPPKPAHTPQNIETRKEFRPQHTTIPHPAGILSGPTAAPRPQHLQQWMENHKNLSLPQQQHALQNEPGFRELPSQVQQSQLNTLGRLYTMDPEQRSRMLTRVEGLERLNPEQQQQWSSAVQQLNIVPTPRRRLMARAIIDLREMPSDQRQQVIESPAFGAQFSPDERQTIRTVLTAY